MIVQANRDPQKYHTKCDRAQPCQACRAREQQCVYTNGIVAEKSSALNALAKQQKTRESSETTHERPTLIPTKRANSSGSGRKSPANSDTYLNFATNLPPHIRSLLGEDARTVDRIPESLIHKLPNHAALQTGRPGHEAVWVNSTGRKVSVSRVQTGSRAWITVAEQPDNPPCALAVAWKSRQETYNCTAYTPWRGAKGFDSEASIYKIIPNKKIPIADLMREIRAHQLSKQPEGTATPLEPLPKRPRREEPTPVVPADKEPAKSQNYFPADVMTKLPAHLRTCLQTYVERNPSEKPLTCAYTNCNKMLSETKSGQKSSWVSKSGQPLNVVQYDLGDYGWIIVAQGTAFPPQIIKYWPWNGYNSRTGRSPFFVWNGSWDESEGPKVFKTWQQHKSSNTINQNHSMPTTALGKRRSSEATTVKLDDIQEQSQTKKTHLNRLNRESGPRARTSIPARLTTPSPAQNATGPPFGSIRLATTMSPEVPISQLVRERQRLKEVVERPNPHIEVRIPSPRPQLPSQTATEEHENSHLHQQISPGLSKSTKSLPLQQAHDPSVLSPDFTHSSHQPLPSPATNLQPSTTSFTAVPDPSTTSSAIRSLFHFRGTRPRTRPFSTCSSVQKLFLQATAAGVFKSLADANMVLCRLGSETGVRDFAVIRDAEDDFEELKSAILESGGVEEVFVKALTLK